MAELPDDLSVNNMRQSQIKTGRPRAERLSDEDVAFVKAQIAESNESGTFIAAQFHREVYDEAGSGAYKGFRLPGDVDSVKSAFARAFKPDSKKRHPLPPLYCRILESLYGITRDNLPSRTAIVARAPIAAERPPVASGTVHQELATVTGSDPTPPPPPATVSTIAPGQIRSLAVMPLLNLSGDPGQDYFVDGVTELLCDELGTVSALHKVTSRTTIMQYKGTTKTLPQIAAELGVDAVVEGSVQREHNTVLVSVHLIDGRADRQLWAETYEREIHGLLKLKTELARAIASKIRIELTPVEQVRIHDVKHVPSAAVDAYLKGRFEYWAPAMHWPQLQKAEDFYQQAITIAPAWGRAHAGLAEVNILRIFQKGQQTTPWLTKAQQSVEHALALDDSLTEAHTVAAWGKMMSHWDWLGAEQEFRRAIELNPNYSLAHTWYGHLLNALGRFGEAATEMMRSQELDPRSPLIYMWLAEPAYLMGDYSQALKIARNLLRSCSDCIYAHFTIAKVFLEQGKFDEAIAECRKLPDRFWEIQVHPVLPRAYALSGRRAEALKVVKEITTNPQYHTPPAYSLACIYTALGETDQALRWLNRAYEERSSLIYKVGVEPAFRRLHGDLRFQALLKKMNLGTVSRTPVNNHYAPSPIDISPKTKPRCSAKVD
ncbi:MAG: tetratricopeptide repeat protein [Verrucomicrobiota bacterium]